MPIVTQYVNNSMALIAHFGRNDVKIVAGVYLEGYVPHDKECPALFFMENDGNRGYNPKKDVIKIVLKFTRKEELDGLIDQLLETRNIFDK